MSSTTETQAIMGKEEAFWGAGPGKRWEPPKQGPRLQAVMGHVSQQPNFAK